MKLSVQRGNRDKIHICIDGEYKITTNADYWAKLGYRDGDEVDEAEFDELCCSINARKALTKCAEYIGRREYSAKQVTLKLIQGGFDEEIAEDAVQQCVDSGIIDDRRFARAYIAHLYNFKLLPLARIRYELAAAGVNKTIAEEEIDSAEIDDLQSLAGLIDKKYRSRLDFADKKAMEKVTASLARRGFSYYDIKSVLEDIESETENDE